MKILIKQSKFCYENEQIFQNYPILEKYRDKMEYYVEYDDGSNPNYYSERDYNQYWQENCFVVEMNNEEMFKALQEFTSYSNLIIGYASKYDHEHYNIDFLIEFYDDYRE